jgi:hypothetical protein
LGGRGIPPPTFFIVSESGHLSCDADHKKSLFDLGSLTTAAGSGGQTLISRNLHYGFGVGCSSGFWVFLVSQ